MVEAEAEQRTAVGGIDARRHGWRQWWGRSEDEGVFFRGLMDK